MQRDRHSGNVCSVRCQFCIYNGKEDAIGEKRKRTQTDIAKDWTKPFRTSKYRDHHVSQHKGSWEVYQKLSYDQKKEYFENKVEHNNTIEKHFAVPTRTHTVYFIDAPIVDKIIGEMFFHPDDQDGITRARALKLFDPQTEDPNVYSVTIKYPMQFSLIVSWLARGVSFRQAQDIFLSTRRITGAMELGTINDTGVSNYARVVCAINLSKLSTILNNKSMWAFSLANDSSTYYGKSYLDNRIRFHCDGVIHNVHFLAIPMFESHSGEYMFRLVKDVFDIICPTWRTKLISMSSDGASAMTGGYQGIVTRIEKEVFGSNVVSNHRFLISFIVFGVVYINLILLCEVHIKTLRMENGSPLQRHSLVIYVFNTSSLQIWDQNVQNSLLDGQHLELCATGSSITVFDCFDILLNLLRRQHLQFGGGLLFLLLVDWLNKLMLLSQSYKPKIC
jgi:hypothetical protein